ncbi:dynein heavy chain domain-containing protein 1 [Amia ocellicauda]|uniref:dynein heavy chain domain-containing protein 1 n=1 Tax=Amia ocellicauda TaxID=2972642 RepID=UPI003464E497
MVEDCPYRPYDLRMVRKSQLKPQHYVFSPHSVLHVQPGHKSELVSLGTWHREAVLWRALQEIPFFKNYLICKAFTRWHRNVCQLVLQRRQGSLERLLLMAVPQFREALLQLSRLIEELRRVHWLPQDDSHTYTLMQFQSTLYRTNQDAHGLLEKFLHYCTVVLHMAHKKSYKAFQELQAQLEHSHLDRSSESLYLQMVQHKEHQHSLQQAEDVLQRLGSLASLANHMIIQTLVTIVQREVTSFVNNVMKTGQPDRVSLFRAQLVFSTDNRLTLFPPIQLFEVTLSGALVSVSNSALQVFDSFIYIPARKEFLAAGHSTASENQRLGSSQQDKFFRDLRETECKLKDINAPTFPNKNNVRAPPAPGLVLSQLGPLKVQGQRLKGQYYPMSTKQLEWHLCVNAEVQEAEREQGRITKEALREVEQLCEDHCWLAHIHTFTSQWNAKSLEPLQGQTASQYEDRILQVRVWIKKVKMVPRTFTTRNKLLTVDCSDVQEKIVPQLYSIEGDILSFLTSEVEQRAETWVLELRRAVDKLRGTATDFNAFAQYTSMVKRYQNMSCDLQQQLDYVHSLQETIRMHYRQLSKAEESMEEQMLDLWHSFVQLLQVAVMNVSMQLPCMAETLDGSFSSLCQELQALVSEATSERYLEPFQSAVVLLEELKGIDRQFYSVVGRLNELSRTSQNLKGSPLDLSFITSAEQKLEAIKGLWELLNQSTDQINEWQKLPFSKFEVRHAQEKVAEWLEKASLLGRAIPAQDVVHRETQLIENFSQQLPLLAKLSSPALKHKHWRNLFKDLGLLYEPQKHLSVSDLLYNKLLEHQNSITKIWHNARAEADMEQTFRKLQSRWDQEHFRLANFILTVWQEDLPPDHSKRPPSGRLHDLKRKQHSQDSGTFIIIGLENLLALTEDSMMILSNMMMLLDFRQEVESWIQLLQELEQLLGLWERYQQKWVLLSKMFYETEVSIQKPELVSTICVLFGCTDPVQVLIHMVCHHKDDQLSFLSPCSAVLGASQYAHCKDIYNLQSSCLLAACLRHVHEDEQGPWLCRFKPIDETYREMIQAISSSPRVLNIVRLRQCTNAQGWFQGQNLHAIFIEGLATMDTISDQLLYLLHSPRSEFPRLNFLSDGEVINLLSLHPSPSALLPLVRKCFPSVQELDLETHDQQHHTMASLDLFDVQLCVTGVCGSLDEKLPFSSPLASNHDPLAWLCDLEDRLHEAVFHLMWECATTRMAPEPEKESEIGSQNKLSRDSEQFTELLWAVASQFPLQCILVAEEVLWCKEIREFFLNQALNKRIRLKVHYTSKLQDLIQIIQKYSAGFGKNPDSLRIISAFRALVLVVQKHCDIMSRFLEDKNDMESSFEWQKLLKYCFNADPKTVQQVSDPTVSTFKAHLCYIDVLGSHIPYGYEYVGPDDWMIVNTPSSDRAVLGLLLSLTSSRCGLLIGPSMSGKSKTVVHLGKALGQQVIMLHCAQAMSPSIILQMLSGALQTGAWLVLDSVNMMTQETLSLLGQHISDIQNSLTALQKKTQHQGEYQHCPSEGLFSCNSLLQRDCLTSPSSYIRENGHNTPGRGSVTSVQISQARPYEPQSLGLISFAGITIPAKCNYSCILIVSGSASEMPENLRVASRPISLIQPDYKIIAEVLLASLGFSEAESLAKRLVSLFTLAQNSLCLPQSVTNCTNWLVTLKKIITAAGIHFFKHNLKGIKKTKTYINEITEQTPQTEKIMKSEEQKGGPKMLWSSSISRSSKSTALLQALAEEQAVLKAISEVLCSSTFENRKAFHFHGLLKETFSASLLEGMENEEIAALSSAVTQELQETGLQSDPRTINNVLTLYQALKLSRAVILVGQAGSGKTASYRALAGALRKLATRVEETDYNEGANITAESSAAVRSTWTSVNTVVVFPNSLSGEEFWGTCNHHKQQGSWRDGAFTKIVRDSERHNSSSKDLNQNGQTPKQKWVVLDGEPLSEGWLDSLCTLFDPEDPFICLPNGEKVRPSQEELRLVLEVTELDSASPSAVTRCGLVYHSEKDVWKAIWKTELEALYQEQNLNQATFRLWSRLAEDLFSSTLTFLRHKGLSPVLLELSFPRGDKTVAHGVQEVMSFIRILHAFLQQCPTGKGKTLGTGLRHRDKRGPRTDIGCVLARPQSCGPDFRDSGVDVAQEGVWPFMFAAGFRKPNAGTYDKYTYLLDLLLDSWQPVLLVGETGAGKTTLTQTLLRQDRPHLRIPASPCLSAADLRSVLERIGSHKPKVSAPSSSPFGVKQPCVLLFIDDLHDTLCDVGSRTSTVAETLRQCVSKGGVLTSNGYHFKLFNSSAISYLATCVPPRGSGRICVSPRLYRLFTVLALPNLTKEHLVAMHSPKVLHWLKEFPIHTVPQYTELANCIVGATVDVYAAIKKHFPVHPENPYLQFSLHDLQKVFQGMFLCIPHNTPQQNLHCSSCPETDSTISSVSIVSTKDFSAALMNIAHLWMHECFHTFGDRLSTDEDRRKLVSLLAQVSRKRFCSKEPDPQVNKGEQESSHAPSETLENTENPKSSQPILPDKKGQAEEDVLCTSELCQVQSEDSDEFSLNISSAYQGGLSERESIFSHLELQNITWEISSEVELKEPPLVPSEKSNEGDRDDDSKEKPLQLDKSPAGPNSVAVLPATSLFPENVPPPLLLQPSPPNQGKPSGKADGNLGRRSKWGVYFKSNIANPVPEQKLTSYFIPPYLLQGIEATLRDIIFCSDFCAHLQSPAQQYNMKRNTLYQVKDMELLVQQLSTFLLKQNREEIIYPKCFSGPVSDLVVFREGVRQLAHILRVLLLPGGHAALLGMSKGTGRKTLVRLAVHLTGNQLFEVISCNELQVREMLKEASNHAGILGRSTVILVHEGVSQQALDELLVVMSEGTFPGLYSQSELSDVTQKITSLTKNARNKLREEQVLERYYTQVQKNLHVFLLLSLSPKHKDHSENQNKVQTSVQALGRLLKLCSCVEVYEPWTTQSLIEVAARCLQDINLAPELKGKAIHSRLMAHGSRLRAMSTVAIVTSVAAVQQSLQCEVDVQRSQCESARQHCLQEESLLSQLSEQLQQTKHVSQQAFNEVSPLYQAALDALRSLRLADIEEIRSYRVPPEIVVLVMDAVCLMFGKPSNWESGKQLIGQANFFQDLEFYDKSCITDSLYAALGMIVQQPLFQPCVVREASQACESLCLWVRSMYQYASVQRHLAPQRARVQQVEEAMERSRSRLGQERMHEGIAREHLEDLERRHQGACRRVEELSAQLHQAERRESEAQAAAQLVLTHISDWTIAAQEAAKDNQTSPGDALVLAAAVSYLGPFAPDVRMELLEKWQGLCRSGEMRLDPEDQRQMVLTSKAAPTAYSAIIPLREDIPLSRVLGSSASTPQSFSHRLLLQLVVRRSSCPMVHKWPLLVDSEQLSGYSAETFLEEFLFLETEKDILQAECPSQQCSETQLVIPADDPALLEKLCHGAERGFRVLVTHMERAVPSPELQHLLQKQAKHRHTSFSRNPVHHPNFRLYLSTHLPLRSLHELDPAILKMVNVIDFSLSPSELQELLLKELVVSECPEIWDQQGTVQTNRLQLLDRMQQEEDSLFEYILQSLTTLLSDPQFLPRVSACQSKMLALRQDLQELLVESNHHCLLLKDFGRVAWLGSALYRALQEVSQLSPLYLFSLQPFLQVVRVALVHKRGKEASNGREFTSATMAEITHRMVSQVVAHYRPCLFYSHYKLFQLLVSVALIRHNGECTSLERHIFLKGLKDMVTSSGIQYTNLPKVPTWLEEHTHREICLLENILAFKGLSASLFSFCSQWKEYFKFPSSTVIGPVPCPSHAHLSTLQRAMLWKTLHPDWLTAVAEDLTACQLGQTMVTEDSEVTNISSRIVSQPALPVVFLLPSKGEPGPSTYPLYWVEQAAQAGADCQVKLHVISFGNICHREPILQEIDTCSKEGHWLVFNNCHLLDQWDREVLSQLTQLLSYSSRDEHEEKVQQHLEDSSPAPAGQCIGRPVHPQFRLWFITRNDAPLSVPVPVKACALVLACDSPWELRETVLTSLRQAAIRHTPPPELLARCAILHSILLHRQSYDRLVQGLPHCWTQEDLFMVLTAWDRIQGVCVEPVKALEFIAGKLNMCPMCILLFFCGHLLSSNPCPILALGSLVYGGHSVDSEDLGILQGVARSCFRPPSPQWADGPHVLPEAIGASGHYGLFPGVPVLQVLEQRVQRLLCSTDPVLLGFSAGLAGELIRHRSQTLSRLLLESQGSGLRLQPPPLTIDLGEARQKLQALWESLGLKRECRRSGAQGPLYQFMQQEWNRISSLVSALLADLSYAKDCGVVTQVAHRGPLDSPQLLPLLSQLESQVGLLKGYLFGEAPPAAYHLSAFHNSKGFLVALLWERVQAEQRDISEFSLQYQVKCISCLYTPLLSTQVMSSTFHPSSPPHSGAYITGLQLHNALWDTRLGVVQETLSPKPCTLPIVWLRAETELPREADSLSSTPLYHCPVYLGTATERDSLRDNDIITHIPLMAKLDPILCTLRRVRIMSTLQTKC